MPFSGFRQRLDGIEKTLTALGEVELEDLATTPGPRAIALRVDAPGYGLPTVAVFEYRERYRRTREGWLRDLYAYEYRLQPRPSRLAYHDHEPQGIHQHCHEAGRPERHPHFEDRPRLLEETHEAFERLYLGQAAVRCEGLRPLRQPAAKLALSTRGPRRRALGSLRGKIVIRGDFKGPLPREIGRALGA